MDAILKLLHNNKPLTEQLQAATSTEDATRILVNAAKKSGHNVSESEVAAMLAQRPATNPEVLDDAELEAVSGGLMPLPKESEMCCFTCRTSAIMW